MLTYSEFAQLAVAPVRAEEDAVDDAVSKAEEWMEHQRQKMAKARQVLTLLAHEARQGLRLFFSKKKENTTASLGETGTHFTCFTRRGRDSDFFFPSQKERPLPH